MAGRGKTLFKDLILSVFGLSLLEGASLISERFQGKPELLTHLQMIKVPDTGIQPPDLSNCGWVVLPHDRSAKLM